MLQDNFLSYYKDEKAFTESRPDGIVYCEQCRIYELDQVPPPASTPATTSSREREREREERDVY